MRLKTSTKMILLAVLLTALFPAYYLFVQTNMHALDNDAAAMKRFAFISGSIQRLVKLPAHPPALVADIDDAFRSLQAIYIDNPSNRGQFAKTGFLNDYALLTQCWQTLKKQLTSSGGSETVSAQSEMCWLSANKAVFQAQYIIEQKQSDLLNTLFYATVAAIAAAAVLILILFTYVRRELEGFALYDVQTHLFNRRYFNEELTRQCQMAQRKNQPLSLLYLKLDGSGELSNRFVKAYAEKLNAVTRGSDTLFHVAYATFAVLAPGTSAAELTLLARRILTVEGTDKKSFCSVTEYDPAQTPEAFESAALQALKRFDHHHDDDEYH